MPLSSLHAILAAMVTLNNREHRRILSVRPSDEACAKGVADDIFDGNKWIKYQCVEGKGTKIEYVYELVEPDKGAAHRRAQGKDTSGCEQAGNPERFIQQSHGYVPIGPQTREKMIGSRRQD